jgi:hypothetical protein
VFIRRGSTSRRRASVLNQTPHAHLHHQATRRGAAPPQVPNRFFPKSQTSPSPSPRRRRWPPRRSRRRCGGRWWTRSRAPSPAASPASSHPPSTSSKSDSRYLPKSPIVPRSPASALFYCELEIVGSLGWDRFWAYGRVWAVRAGRMHAIGHLGLRVIGGLSIPTMISSSG